MTVSQREITLRFLAEPTDVNFGGKVHGGMVMKWIDLAAYACATGWSGKYCITAYAGGIQFVKPIHVGHLVEVNAKIIYTGSTSIHMRIEVMAGDPKEKQTIRTTHCVVIMVAVDETGKPSRVPNWQAETAEDEALQKSAIRLMELRKQITDEMSSHVLSHV